MEGAEADMMKALHERQLQALSDVLKNRIAPGSSKKAPTAAAKRFDLASVVAASPRPDAAENADPQQQQQPRGPASLFTTPSRLRLKRNKNKDSAATASASSAALRLVKPAAPHREVKSWQEAVLTIDLAALTPAERARQECIYELIRSEAEFVSVLEAIESTYGVPLQHAKVFSLKEYDTVFGNFGEVLTAHRKFLQELEIRQQESFFIDTIADALTAFVSSASVHVAYGGNQHRMEAEVRRQLQVNKEFISFVNALSEQSKSKRTIVNVREDLLKPIARVQQYARMFQEILAHTPTEHIDNAGIRAALAGLEALLAQTAAKRKENDNFDRITELQTSIDFSVVGNKPVLLTRSQNGKVVREGRVCVLTLGKEMRARSRKDVHLIVIDDMLFILGDSTDGKKPYKLLYAPAVLTNVTTMDVPDLDFERSNMFELRMTDPLELLVLQSPNADDKQAWMRLFGFKAMPVAPVVAKPVSAAVRNFERRASTSSTTEDAEGESRLQRRPSQTHVKDKRDIFENLLEMTGLRKTSDKAAMPPVAPTPAAQASAKKDVPTEYTEQMLGVAENERLVVRAAVSILSLVSQSTVWTKLGTGEMALVFNRGNRKTRFIFFREEDKDNFRASAAVSTWLQPHPMVNEKVLDQTNNRIRLVMIVAQGLPMTTFVVRFKTTQERDAVWDAIEKYKYPDGERPVTVSDALPPVPSSPVVSLRSHVTTPSSTPSVPTSAASSLVRPGLHVMALRAANPSFSVSSVSSTDSAAVVQPSKSASPQVPAKQDDDDEVDETVDEEEAANDSDSASESDAEADASSSEEEDSDVEADDVSSPAPKPVASMAEELAQLRALVIAQQKELEAVRAEALQKQLAMNEMLEKRAYEQRKVQEFMAKTRDKQAALKAENEALQAANAALQLQLKQQKSDE